MFATVVLPPERTVFVSSWCSTCQNENPAREGGKVFFKQELTVI